MAAPRTTTQTLTPRPTGAPNVPTPPVGHPVPRECCCSCEGEPHYFNCGEALGL